MPATKDSTPAPVGKLKPAYRIGISVAIGFHLLATFGPPLAFQTRGALGNSPSVETLLAPVRGYGQFLYIDRGYAFFAPDPGPSHLFQAAITDSTGETVEQMYPDLDRQWPRLLYHRHFMLAEFLNEIYQPPGPPPQLQQIDRQGYAAWKQLRARYERVRQSFVEHLETRYPDHEVAIRRLEHAIPGFAEFLAESIQLDDPRLYRVLLDRPVPLPPREGEIEPMEPGRPSRVLDPLAPTGDVPGKLPAELPGAAPTAEVSR